MPPRHGKSEFVSKYCPAWFVKRYLDRRCLLAGYSDDFARKWGKAARSLVRQHGEHFGVSIDPDNDAGNDWSLDGFEGGMHTAGIGGPFTGLGAHYLVIDDPIKNADEALSDKIRESHWDWFSSTAWTRLEPGGVVVVMATRWHDDDLIGRLHKRADELDGAPLWLHDDDLAASGLPDQLHRIAR